MSGVSVSYKETLYEYGVMVIKCATQSLSVFVMDKVLHKMFINLLIKCSSQGLIFLEVPAHISFKVSVLVYLKWLHVFQITGSKRYSVAKVISTDKVDYAMFI